LHDCILKPLIKAAGLIQVLAKMQKKIKQKT